MIPQELLNIILDFFKNKKWVILGFIVCIIWVFLYCYAMNQSVKNVAYKKSVELNSTL